MTDQDFIPHDGLSMPVPADAYVKVKFRDGRTVDLKARASWWHGSGSLASCWINDGSAADIVAYRIVP